MSDFSVYPVNSPAGVNFSKEPSLLNPLLWDEAQNVSFRHGKTFKCPGYEQGFGDAQCIPEVIVPLRADDNNFYWWTYAGTRFEKDEATGKWDKKVNKAYKVTSKKVHDDVTPVNGFVEDHTFLSPVKWSGATINSIPYLCLGKPYVYTSRDNRYEPMHKFPKHVNFRIMRTYRNFMVGLNFETQFCEPDFENGFSGWAAGTHQNALWWSHEVIGGNIQPSKDWDDDPDPEAATYEKSMWCDSDPTRNSGWNFLGGSGGPILEAKELRDNFIIYRELSVWQMSYIGGVNVFAFKELFDDTGALNGNCVVEIEGQHFVIGASDVYMHNGVSKKSVVDGIVRKEIFSHIIPKYKNNVFLSVDYKDKEVWVCIPSFEGDEDLEDYENPEDTIDSNKGACNVAYVYNWLEETWSKRSIPNIISSSFTILDIPDEDISWNAESEGGPLQDPDGIPDSGDEYGFDYQGSTWEEASDNWIDSYYKYSSANWGLVFGSTKVVYPDSPMMIDDWNEDYDFSWDDVDRWVEDQPRPTEPQYHLYTSNRSNLFDGYNYEAVVEKRWMDMRDRSDASFINKVYPLVRNGVVDIYMSGTTTIEQAPVWRFIGTFDPLKDTKLSCRISGEFVHIKFIIPETSRAEIRGYNLEFSKIGRRA